MQIYEIYRFMDGCFQRDLSFPTYAEHLMLIQTQLLLFKYDLKIEIHRTDEMVFHNLANSELCHPTYKNK